jgi:H+/Cl- antiporter ClcA
LRRRWTFERRFVIAVLQGPLDHAKNVDMKLVRSGRLLRLAKVLSARWQRRSIFLLGGIAVGAAAVALALLADLAQATFIVLLAKFPYISFLVTPAGFMLSVFLTNRHSRNSQGSDIPQAIAARQLNDQAARQRLVSTRIAVGKILLTSLGLLCGASVGREGPTVQVGASISSRSGVCHPAASLA